jgi:hypothetical protein
MTTPWTGYATIVADHRTDLLTTVATPRRAAGRTARAVAGAPLTRLHRASHRLSTAAPDSCT